MSTQNLTLQILGIDAAVDPRNTGYAIATSETGKWRIDTLSTGTRTTDLADQIAARLDPQRPTLLAIDAPLGWPRPLAESLAHHRPGEPLNADPAIAFARETDRFVREKTGLKPLDVGADRIARTAAAALELIERLRATTGQPLPLLADLEIAALGGLIEVYPAATLKQRGLPFRQYKKPEAKQLRHQIAEAIEPEIDLGEARKACIDSDHCLDAALCLLTAMDLLDGHCHAPANPHWQREGWIWFPRTRRN